MGSKAQFLKDNYGFHFLFTHIINSTNLRYINGKFKMNTIYLTSIIYRKGTEWQLNLQSFSRLTKSLHDHLTKPKT